MSRLAKNTRATVIPCLRYRNAPSAIEWLCETFGFEKQLVVPSEDGTIAHAQLNFGNGMIMLGSVLEKETEFGRLIKQPDEIGGFETQSPYVVVSDADEIYRRAKAALREFRLRKAARGTERRWDHRHAQLRFGNGMIMLGSVLEVETEFGRLIK